MTRATTTLIAAGAMWYVASDAGRVSAQTATCDPGLVQPSTSNDPQAYRLRGDRCEGIYAQPVANTTLVVASFLENFDAADLAAASHLDVRWTTPAPAATTLRATALQRRTYYRMDTQRPAGSDSYAWPTDVLAALDIPRPELGVLAWVRQRVGGVERDVHLPLRIGSERPADATGTYTLVLLPEVALTEVYVTIARVGPDGDPETFIRDEEPLGYNYYPAERAIEIPFARPAAPGTYYVLIGAGIRGGGSLTTEFWFHAPPA